jgi:hypothetical protein
MIRAARELSVAHNRSVSKSTSSLPENAGLPHLVQLRARRQQAAHPGYGHIYTRFRH